MRERPILFSTPMVQAITDGRKTQTRRIVNNRHLSFIENLTGCFLDGKWSKRPMPYGVPGDRLWVKETFSIGAGSDIIYKAKLPWYWAGACNAAKVWRPSLFMSRKQSRINLEITEIKVERLNEISAQDAEAEGIEKRSFEGTLRWAWGDSDNQGSDSPVGAYRSLWERINGSGSWETNPWVWVIKFRYVQ